MYQGTPEHEYEQEATELPPARHQLEANYQKKLLAGKTLNRPCFKKS